MYNAAWYAWTRASGDDAEEMAGASLKGRVQALREYDEGDIVDSTIKSC